MICPTYKARVVHSPLNSRYKLQIKNHWWSVWTEIDSSEYRAAGKPKELYYPIRNQEELYEYFIIRANELMAETVVYVAERNK